MSDDTPMHAYRLQIRPGIWAQLVIPDDITEAEIKKLSEWAKCLVIDGWDDDE